MLRELNIKLQVKNVMSGRAVHSSKTAIFWLLVFTVRAGDVGALSLLLKLANGKLTRPHFYSIYVQVMLYISL